MKKIFLLSLLLFQPVFAEMTCDISVDEYYALYKPSVFTCNAGYFLPANAVSCVPCPNGFVCLGGTFEFNADIFQGLDFDSVPGAQMNNVCAANFPLDLQAVYIPNTHTCSAGTYLPAGVDSCTACPTGYTCNGGTYTFNEIADQGKTVNTITITWEGGTSTTCDYGGSFTTPTNPPTAPRGYHFVGWSFD